MGSLPGLEAATFSLCPHMAETEGERERESKSKRALVPHPFLIRATALLDWGLILITSLNFSHLLKALSPNRVTLGVRLQHIHFGETQLGS